MSYSSECVYIVGELLHNLSGLPITILQFKFHSSFILFTLFKRPSLVIPGRIIFAGSPYFLLLQSCARSKTEGDFLSKT